MLISKAQIKRNQPTNQDLRHKRYVIFTQKIKKVVTYTKHASTREMSKSQVAHVRYKSLYIYIL